MSVTGSLFLYANAEESPIGDASIFYNLSDVDRGIIPQAGSEDPDFERLEKSQRQTVGFSNRINRLPLSYKLFYNEYESELVVYTDETYGVIDEVEKAEDYSWGGMLYSTLQTSEHNTLVRREPRSLR